jgi:hypothetical protein
MKYAPLGIARYRTVADDTGDFLVIPPSRSAWMLLLLGFGIFACCNFLIESVVLFRLSDNPALLLAVAFVALVIVFFALGLAWLMVGTETVRVKAQDLEIEYAILGFRRRRLYRGQDVRGLEHARSEPAVQNNPVKAAVRFTYGSRTVNFAFGMDHSEACGMIDWLRQRLPEAAA